MIKDRAQRPRTITRMSVAAAAALLALVGAGEGFGVPPGTSDEPAVVSGRIDPRETPYRFEEPVASTGSARAAAPVRHFAEPGPAGLLYPDTAILAADLQLQGPPDSPAVAAALARVQARPAPAGEVFAIVTVTDRATGERRLFTRGVIDLVAARAAADPDLAPPGSSYEESVKAAADAHVEIVVRSIVAHPADPRLAAGTDRAEENELDLRQRNTGGGLSHRIDGTLRSRIASGEIDIKGQASIPVVIDMRGLPKLRIPKIHDLAPAGLLYVGLDVQADREKALIERKRDIAARQSDLAAAIASAGGRVRARSWMSGAIHADVPAEALEKLSARGDVFRLDYEEPLEVHDHRYQGNDYYVATDAQDFDPYHAGLHGVTGKHDYTSRVVLAMEEECIDVTNPAWLTANNAFSRAWFYDCDGGACTQGGVEECSGSNPHGTRVAQLMAGDFMENQDPGLAPINRRVVTGACEECNLVFLQDEGLTQRPVGHAAACDLGVDVFESSVGTQGTSCDGIGIFGSDIEAMAACDVAYVQSAGNSGSGGGCSTNHPADHPWALAVAGMLTENPCDTSGEYYTSTCPFAPGSSIGGGVYDVSGTASIIGLTAPHKYSNALIPLTRNPVQWGDSSGTSFAAPLVAGLAARLMDWWRIHLDSSIFYANRIHTVMLLMGDRSANSNGASQVTTAFSSLWGAGRVGLVPFDTLPYWSMMRASKTLAPGETWTLTDDVLGRSAKFYKIVVWHDGTDFENEPMIALSVAPQTCNNGAQSVQRLDSKALVVFTGPFALDNCQDATITVGNAQVGSSGTRTFHVAAYSAQEDERHF